MFPVQRSLNCIYFCLHTVVLNKIKTTERQYPIEPPHEISNNVVCAISKGSDQPAYMSSLVGAFASRLNIL